MRNELLIIDDADLHLSILCKIAQQVGFTTTGAHSAAEAIELVRQRTFDCITLDLSLGDQSGIEVLKALAEIKCRTPVIVISDSGDEVREETIRIGNFLNLNVRVPIPKPVHLAALRKALTQLAAETEQQKLAVAVG